MLAPSCAPAPAPAPERVSPVAVVDEAAAAPAAEGGPSPAAPVTELEATVDCSALEPAPTPEPGATEGSVAGSAPCTPGTEVPVEGSVVEDTPGSVTHEATEIAEEIEAYWTPERLAAVNGAGGQGQ